jgi:hypothetical protein
MWLQWSCAPTVQLQLPSSIDSGFRSEAFTRKRVAKNTWKIFVLGYSSLHDSLLIRKEQIKRETVGIILPAHSHTYTTEVHYQLFGNDSLRCTLQFEKLVEVEESGHHSILGDILFPPKQKTYDDQQTTSSRTLVHLKGFLLLTGAVDSIPFFFQPKKEPAVSNDEVSTGYVLRGGDSMYLKPFYSYKQYAKNQPPTYILEGYMLYKKEQLMAYVSARKTGGTPQQLYVLRSASPAEQLVLAAYCYNLWMAF